MEPTFEFVTINSVSKVRRAMLHGRHQLVAHMVIIVPGVLPGSQGPLLYLPEDTGKNPAAWDFMPITVYHPMIGNRHVSARTPAIWDKQGVGNLYNTRFKKTLNCEGWYDAERTERVDNRVYQALVKNEPMELSTGLFTYNERVAANSRWLDGREYVGIARNHQPDHVASLPDQKGACSLKDGCGINVNLAAQEWFNDLPDSYKRYLWTQGIDLNFNELPSEEADISPEKACKILEDGEVNGQPLTDAQKGMLGALCSQKDKVENKDQFKLFSSIAKSILDKRHRSDQGRFVHEAHTGIRAATRQGYSILDALPIYKGLGADDDSAGESTAEDRAADEAHSPQALISGTVETNNMKLTPEQRAAIVGSLVGNCNCQHERPWKGKDAAFLNGLSDNELSLMDAWRKADVAGGQAVANQGNTQTLTTTTVNDQQQTPAIPSQLEATINNAVQAAIQRMLGNVPLAQPVNTGNQTQQQQTPAGNTQQQKSQEVSLVALAQQGKLSAKDQAIWNSAVALHDERKNGLIEQIVNGLEGEARTQQIAFLNTKEVDELNNILMLRNAAAPPQQQQQRVANYFGNQPPPMSTVVNEAPMKPITYNFAAPGKKKASTSAA